MKTRKIHLLGKKSVPVKRRVFGVDIGEGKSGDRSLLAAGFCFDLERHERLVPFLV